MSSIILKSTLQWHANEKKKLFLFYVYTFLNKSNFIHTSFFFFNQNKNEFHNECGTLYKDLIPVSKLFLAIMPSTSGCDL